MLTTGISGIFGTPVATELARSIEILRDSYTAKNISAGTPGRNISMLSSAPATISTHTFQDSLKIQAIHCDGGDQDVSGSSNSLTYTGPCNVLTVRGNNNWITLENPATVVDLGKGNNIAMRIPPADGTQTSPETYDYITGIISIHENNQDKQFSCFGASVVVYGSANTLSIQGTCGSLTIRGDGNQIRLENPTILFNSGTANILEISD